MFRRSFQFLEAVTLSPMTMALMQTALTWLSIFVCAIITVLLQCYYSVITV